MTFTKIVPADLDSPRRELSNGGLKSVVTLLIHWQIISLSACIGRPIQLYTHRQPLTCILGDVVFQWLMKMSKDCHSPAEYNRFHAELSYFLEERDAVKALSRDRVAAVFQLKRTLRYK